jgi:hypothetical protein
MKMMYYVINLLNYTLCQLKSQLFVFQHRISQGSFSRSPKLLTFDTTALMILHMVKKAIAVEIMHFFGQYHKENTPSRQAFSKARDKISYTAIKDFFEKSCELAREGVGARVYKGYRLFAQDGTAFFVGDMDNESLREYFGESTTVAGKAMCRLGGIVDVLNDFIVSAAVSGYDVGERALAIRQIEELSDAKNILFLFDRGYWSPELIKTVIKNGQKFLMRLASSAGRAIVKDEYGKVIKLRRYSFALPSGDIETLLTNLSAEEVSDEELAQLYAMRWGIETKYLELKDRLQIDNLSGKSANTVLQDIYATLYISNLVAFLCFEADEIIQERTAAKNNKYTQKVNRSICIAVLRERFIQICLLPTHILRAALLYRMVKDIAKCVTYVGSSKSKPRDKRKIKTSRSRPIKKPIL